MFYLHLPVVHFSNGGKPLLACGVPDVQFDGGVVIQQDVAGDEGSSYCSLRLIIKISGCKLL